MLHEPSVLGVLKPQKHQQHGVQRPLKGRTLSQTQVPLPRNHVLVADAAAFVVVVVVLVAGASSVFLVAGR